MRTRATILSTIWHDDDWTALSHGAQWLYELLLSQARLSLAGHLDLMPGRWAGFCSTLTERGVVELLEELEDARFVAVDWTRGELVIRTFTAHDFRPGSTNKNLLGGFWSAWTAILSPTLRQIVVRNMPEWLWSKAAGAAPPEAARIRMSEPEDAPRLEPDTPRRLEPEDGERFEPPPPPPPTPTPPLPPPTVLVTTNSPEDEQAQIRMAARVAAERKAARLGDRGEGWIVKATEGMHRDHNDAARALLAAGRPLDAIVDLMDPPAPRSTHPEDLRQAAAQATYEANAERIAAWRSEPEPTEEEKAAVRAMNAARRLPPVKAKAP